MNVTDTINELESLCAENGIEIVPIPRLVKDELTYISLVAGDTALHIYQIDYNGALIVGDMTPKKTIDILLDRVESHKNEELRELVRHLRECTRHNACALCEYADVACDFDYDMRELGIEVGA